MFKDVAQFCYKKVDFDRSFLQLKGKYHEHDIEKPKPDINFTSTTITSLLKSCERGLLSDH